MHDSPDFDAFACQYAARRPRLACAFLAGDYVPVVYTLKVSFPTVSTETSGAIEVFNPEMVSCDLLICDMAYSVERPKYNVGSLFRSQEEVENEKIPGIGIELQLNYCPEVLVSLEDTPINLVLRPSVVCCKKPCRPFLLPYDTNIIARVTLIRDVSLTELPIDLTIAFTGFRVLPNDWRRRSDEEVEDYLAFRLEGKYVRRSSDLKGL